MSCGHPCECPTYRQHLLSIGFAASAMPTRKAGVAKIEATEKQWDADMPAYKRLRRNGIQPTHIDGSARLEAKANDTIEVETGVLREDVPA